MRTERMGLPALGLAVLLAATGACAKERAAPEAESRSLAVALLRRVLRALRRRPREPGA